MKLATPKGLSSQSADIWAAVTAENAFSAHETPLLEAWLRWADRSEAWFREAQSLTGTAQAALLKRAMDAATTSLRFRKALKFTDPDAAVRRPGRPSGDGWNAKRKTLREAI